MKKLISKSITLLMTIASAGLLSACSEDKFAGGVTEDAGLAIKDLDVAGLAQKGPFVKGSVVTVQGVDCKTMKFTEEEFTGKVKSNKGDFGVDDVNLSATCALFAVSGYYMNEFTGEKSSDKLTLHAITDLSDRKNVNINVLTELEYERVMKLVSKEKMSFDDAKMQAEKEILAALGLVDRFESFEGLNIYEKGDGNATLLATSVMLQSDLDAEKLTDRLDGFASSITESGEWDDEKTKKEMADWADSAKSDGKYDTVRDNLEKWSGSDEIPDFEKVVDEINKDAKETTQKIPEEWSWDVPQSARLNPNIKYDSMVDPRDKQVYKVVKIDVPDTNYSQVWMAENLNYADSVKTPSLKGRNWCYNDDEKNCNVSGRYYSWAAAIDSVALANDSKEPLDCGYGKKCGLDRAVQGICPEGWHLPTLREWSLLCEAIGDYRTCGEPLKALTGWNYAGTPNNNGTDLYGFAALPTGRRISATSWEKVGSDVYYWSSTEQDDDRGRYFNINNIYTQTYTYQNSKYYGQSVRCIKGDPSTAAIKSSSSSEASSSSQSSSSETSVSSSSVLLATPCKTEAEDNCEYGTLTDSRDGQTYKTVKIGNQTWMAENLNYAYLQPTDSLDSSSFCYNDSLKYCEKYGRLYFWSAVMDSAATWSENGKGCGYGVVCTPTFPVRGVCPAGWHIPNRDELYELVLAVGGENDAGDALNASSTLYEQNPYGFSFLPSGRKRIVWFDKDDGEYIYDDDGEYGYIWSSTDDYWNSDESFTKYHDANELVVALSVAKSGSVGLHGSPKTSGYPVRCLKD